MSALADVFARCAAEGRAALIGYLPACFPSYDGAVAALTTLVEAGADIVEIGLPYSDPMMDGPVIQAAVDRALSAGSRTADVLRTVAAVAATGAPALVMSYWNPIERYGAARFAADLAAAGGAGAITPDLTPEEGGEWLAACGEHGLDPVLLVAPSSTEARLRLVCDAAGGFVYAASLMGVTGTRASVGSAARGLVERVRAVTDKPVCVGLGVSDRAQAAEVAAYADGVIVGSALVRCLLDEAGGGLPALRALTEGLAAGVRGR